jgi:hypothetical protein
LQKSNGLGRGGGGGWFWNRDWSFFLNLQREVYAILLLPLVPKIHCPSTI